MLDIKSLDLTCKGRTLLVMSGAAELIDASRHPAACILWRLV